MTTETVAYLGVALAALSAAIAILQWGTDVRYWRLARKITSLEQQSEYSASFPEETLQNSLKTYVSQDCGQLDPSHESDLRRVADLREASFKLLDRFLNGPSYEKHILILADSGMGKTSLCLNYYAHLIESKQPACLFSLARSTALEDISKLKNKRSTVCIIDALDEDALAIKNMVPRLYDIYTATADFKAIIITCRSQFFRDQASIPTDTNIFVVGPRPGGIGSTHKVLHVYLLPFNQDQINLFIKRQFRRINPVNIGRRRAANALIARIPELSVRPMLLDLLPDLVREKTDARELYDLYTYLVNKWFERESHWIAPDVLEKVSLQLAVKIHDQSISGHGDRINVSQLQEIASELGVTPDDWFNLTTRSLLNRDRQGLHKFAHRSVMEYFFVKAAIVGNNNTLKLPWTDVMREIFVSWGYTDDGHLKLARARDILGRNLKATTLIPLSEAPEEPSIITRDDIVRVTSRRSRKRGGRRRANPLWRADSIYYSLSEDAYVVEDKDSNLSWIIVDFEALERYEILDSFYAPLATLLLGESNMKKAGTDFSDYRLPSLEEFLSLIEALEAIGREDILPESPLYVIGDVAGPRRHLLVSLREGEIIRDDLAPFDLGRVIEGTKRKISIYEAGVNVSLGGFSSVRAIALHVRSGLSGSPPKGVRRRSGNRRNRPA